MIELNKPGTIAVSVSVGMEDGVKPGDRLSVLHDGVLLGKIEITKAHATRSVARIIAGGAGESPGLRQ